MMTLCREKTHVELTRWWRHCRCARSSVRSTIWSHIVDARSAPPPRLRSPRLLFTIDTIRYNRWFALENWQASWQFNL